MSLGRLCFDILDLLIAASVLHPTLLEICLILKTFILFFFPHDWIGRQTKYLWWVWLTVQGGVGTWLCWSSLENRLFQVAFLIMLWAIFRSYLGSYLGSFLGSFLLPPNSTHFLTRCPIGKIWVCKISVSQNKSSVAEWNCSPLQKYFNEAKNEVKNEVKSRIHTLMFTVDLVTLSSFGPWIFHPLASNEIK